MQGVGNGVHLNMSDSSRTSYSSSQAFQFNDPNQNPLLHFNDPIPAMINISGSVENLILNLPKPLQMYVTGDIVNSGASIQNLHSTDVSTISAGGQIIDEDNFGDRKTATGTNA